MVEFCLRILALFEVDRCQVIETLRSVWVFWPEHFLPDRQSALIEGLGPLVLTLHPVERSQVVKARGRARVILSKNSFSNHQSTLQERLRCGKRCPLS